MSQLLVENLLLFLMGGALGTIIAAWTLDSLLRLAVDQGYVPQRMAVSIDGRVLAFAAAVSLVTGLTFGLLPALRASRVALSGGLRESSSSIAGGAHRRRTRRVLIVAELMLSLVLLIGFGLVVRSFWYLQTQAPGFDGTRLLQTMSDGGRQFPDAVRYWRESLNRVRTLPGVESAAVSSRPPVHGSRTQRFDVDGPSIAAAEGPRAGDILVSADYFQTLRIPIVKGRAFTEQDDHAAAPVVIVSQTLAQRYFPDQNPVGRRLRLHERTPMSCCSSGAPVENVWREIVGVVGDIRQGNLDESPAATIYRPFTQIIEHDMFLMIKARTDADMTRLATTLVPTLRTVHPASDWLDVRPTSQAIQQSGSLRARRFVLIVLGVFAVLALLLAAVGLYGVMSYFVLERNHEIAVRLALGATRSNVLVGVLGEAGRLVVVGLVLGGVAAYALTRLLSSLLFGVTATDIVTYAAVSTLLGAVALLASYVPASRAASTDPMLALKEP